VTQRSWGQIRLTSGTLAGFCFLDHDADDVWRSVKPPLVSCMPSITDNACFEIARACSLRDLGTTPRQNPVRAPHRFELMIRTSEGARVLERDLEPLLAHPHGLAKRPSTRTPLLPPLRLVAPWPSLLHDEGTRKPLRLSQREFSSAGIASESP